MSSCLRSSFLHLGFKPQATSVTVGRSQSVPVALHPRGRREPTRPATQEPNSLAMRCHGFSASGFRWLSSSRPYEKDLVGARTAASRQIGEEEDKEWPLIDRILAAGPGNQNTAKKVRRALQQLDRLLDVFEPGQLALSFNGGKDSTVLMALVKEACAKHPTHDFTHIQPIWFQNPAHEFPAMQQYVKDVAKRHFTHQEGLRNVWDRDLNRLWSMHITNPRDFVEAMVHLSSSTGLRCVLMGSRRTDPGCRDLSEIALMDLAPIFLSSTLTRMKLETKLNMLKSEGDPGIPGTFASVVKEPSLLRFSPILEWSYRDIWDFLRAIEEPYCPLYDDGYSSIGTMLDTVRNAALLSKNIEPRFAEANAWSGTKERLGGRYEELSMTNALKYNKLGADVYATNTLGGIPGVRQEDLDKLKGRQYYPAWFLTDESREGSSRIKVSEPNSLLFSEGQMSTNASDTAAILIIGDEVVAGLTSENTSHTLGRDLRLAGVSVKQVMKIEDDVDVIAFMVRRLSPVHKYLFIAGGTGAGHEDVTLAAVAKAFGTGMQRHPRLLDAITSCLGADQLTDLHLKMADSPWGSEMLGQVPLNVTDWDELLRVWPVVKKNNCYIFSNRPGIVEQKIETLLEHLGSSPYFATTVMLTADPSMISREVADADEMYEGVSVDIFIREGQDSAEDQTGIRIEGKNLTQQQHVVESFLSDLEEEWIFDVQEHHVAESEFVIPKRSAENKGYKELQY